MSADALMIFLLVGALAGWLAGVIVKGYGFGLIGNMAVGIVGSFIGGWLFGRLDLIRGAGMADAVIGAALGAVILLFALRFARRLA